MSYLGARQHEVNAARASSMEALRAFSQRQTARDFQTAEARAARGLVSVSTSGFGVSRNLPTAFVMAEHSIEIDRPQARVTRMRKGVGVGAKCLLNLGEGDSGNNVMVTLTYRGTNADWQPRHVSDYIRAVRKWFAHRCPGQRLKYLWVAEIQDGKRRADGIGRGVIHYHAIFFLPAGVSMPPADKRGWWPHGFTNTEKGYSPVAYLMSYAKKANSKNVGGFPRGSRLYAVGGLDAPGAAIKRWVLWPAYVQGNAAITDRFRPAEGGGYINAETGQFLESEFAPTGGGFSRFIRVRTTPRQIDASGPFSWAPDFTNTADAGPAAYLH
ncbi:rolling circle replication-associated protein [Variovorax sp. GB1P17]|uniref:rolling circle replication-associated protein n=1 Tax=Variovorax sp. GB1P17 TaxID=3443740 RepID=UPI003F467C9C